MASIPIGAKTLFVQAWLPAGWSRVTLSSTSSDDYALRITDTPGVDNTSSINWTSAMTGGTQFQHYWPATVNGTSGSAITVSPTVGGLAPHTHSYTTGYLTYSGSYLQQYPGGASSGRVAYPTLVINNTSGGAGSPAPTGHTHPFAVTASPGITVNVTMNIKYIDAIVGQKDN